MEHARPQHPCQADFSTAQLSLGASFRGQTEPGGETFSVYAEQNHLGCPWTSPLFKRTNRKCSPVTHKASPPPSLPSHSVPLMGEEENGKKHLGECQALLWILFSWPRVRSPR